MAKLGRARNRAIAQSRSAAAASRSTSLIQRVSRGCFGIRRTNSGPLAALWHPSGSCRWPVGPRPLSVALSVVRAWAGRGVVLSCIVLGSPSPQTLALPHLTVTSLSAPVAASYHKSNKRETMTPKAFGLEDTQNAVRETPVLRNEFNPMPVGRESAVRGALPESCGMPFAARIPYSGPWRTRRLPSRRFGPG